MIDVPPSPESRVFQAGDVVAGRYELRALVGEGGMGAVWRASHIQLTSDVALKLMSPAIAAQPDALQRFLREARAAAKLSSLHVVKVFDYGVDGQTPFIVMELLSGESLRERLDRERVLTPATTAWVLRHAGRALSKAHGEGIVHRDLKPENLFITKQEEEILKVLDFGVAKLASTASGLPTTSTRTGAVLGTPFYMSPEQARGIRAVDHRSDIWALGVIAYECLIGKLPFDSEAFGDLVLKICTLPAPVPSSVAPVPHGFDGWFARVVERDPELRFQSVDAMVEALQPILTKEPAASPTGKAMEPSLSPQLGGTRTDVTASQSVMAAVPKRSPSPWLWLASLVIVALGGLLAFSWLGANSSPVRHRSGASRAIEAEHEARAGVAPAPAAAAASVSAAPASDVVAPSPAGTEASAGAANPSPEPGPDAQPNPVAASTEAENVPAATGDAVGQGGDSAGLARGAVVPKVAPIAETPPLGASLPQPKAPAPVSNSKRPAPAPAVAKPPAAKTPRSDLFSDPD